MEVKWRFFVGAGILVGYFFISNGAPPVPVVAGVVLAACITFFRGRRNPSVSRRRVG